MKCLLVLVVLSIFSGAALASDLSRLTRAKSGLELELALAEEAELRSLRERCKTELAGADLPRACFTVVDLESRIGRLPSAELGRERSWLERLCLTRARAASRVTTLGETKGLPESCRIEVERRREDLRYRMEVEAPDRLFEIRFSDGWTGS